MTVEQDRLWEGKRELWETKGTRMMNNSKEVRGDR